MYQLTEEALGILVSIFVQRIRDRIASNLYPYGNPDVKGVGNKIASGSLYNSIQGSVEIGPDGEPVALISYNDYLNYVNRGRPPFVKRVPLNALIEWIKLRGLTQTIEQQRKGIAYAINQARARRDKHKIPVDVLEEWIKKKGLQMSPEKSTMSLAFAVQKNIFKYGVRPANIYDAGLDDLEAYFQDFPNNLPPDLKVFGDKMFEAVAQDINNFLVKTITKEIQTIKQTT